MWSDVPNASPGTTTTRASLNSFEATSEAVFNPPLPKYALTLGYT